MSPPRLASYSFSHTTYRNGQNSYASSLTSFQKANWYILFGSSQNYLQLPFEKTDEANRGSGVLETNVFCKKKTKDQLLTQKTTSSKPIFMDVDKDFTAIQIKNAIFKTDSLKENDPTLLQLAMKEKNLERSGLDSKRTGITETMFRRCVHRISILHTFQTKSVVQKNCIHHQRFERSKL